MQKTYNELVSITRELARDFLRLQAVNEVRDEILESDKTIKSYEENNQRLNKQLAITEFKMSEIKDNDPEKEEKLKTLNDSKASVLKQIEYNNKSIADYTTAKASKQKRIDDIQSGVKQMCANALSCKSEQLLAEVVSSLAVDKAKE
jgi:ABC-type Fe2+-enterobactin transport system substrate-binding protein